MARPAANGRSRLDGLPNVRNTLKTAINAGQPVADALSQFQEVFVTLNSDYLSPIEAVNTASGDGFASGLMAFEPRLVGWRETRRRPSIMI